MHKRDTQSKKGIVFTAPLGARNKKTAIFEEIISCCDGNDYSQVLYITPAAFSLREAGRQFFSYLKGVHKRPACPSGRKVYIPFQSCTIKGLCVGLYETHGKKNIVSDRLEPLILCEMLGDENIGYADFLSGLLSKIRNYIIGRELAQVKEDIKSLIFEERTMKQAIKAVETLEAYEKELESRGLIDFENAVKNSVDLIREHINPEILVLDGFFDPTPLELEVIGALIEKAGKVYVLVEENAEFLFFFENNGSGLEKKRLKYTNRRETTGYYSYPSLEDEVEGIATGVKALILEGVNPGEIIVSFPAVRKYLPMLKRVFQKHGIPVNAVEYDITFSRPFIALEDMLASIENDYPRNEFLSFLASVHFPKIPAVVKEWAAYFSGRAGIVKGKNAWLSIKDTFLNSTEEEVSPETVKTLDEFQQGGRRVMDFLEELKETETLSLFVDGMERILDTLGFFESLEGMTASPGSNVISQGIDNLFSELRHFAEHYGLKRFNIETAGVYFRHMLGSIKGGDEAVEGVRVVPFEFAAGLECRALFFGGMIEGDLPARPAIDPILPEKVKKALGIPYLEYYLDRQRRYFKRLINISRNDPVFSCPLSDSDKIFLPSPFLDWGMNLTLPRVNIFSEEDILIGEGMSEQRNFSDTLWEGRLQHSKDTMSILMKRFGAGMFFSVTDIDAYRRCPLRFYIERFLGLEKEEPPKFDVEARLWGRLAHKAMEFLYKEGDVAPKEIDGRLKQGLEISLKKFPVGIFWSKVAREIFQKLLPLIREQEADIRMRGFNPYKVEQTLKTSINNLKLKGKIDRIDKKFQISSRINRDKFQTDEKTDKVILLDYKTGSIDKDSLQLPLYASMWQKEMTESVENTGFYSLKDGRVDWHPKRMDMADFLQRALQTAEDLVQRIKKGEFAPAPSKEGECRYCYHSALCKKETQMTAEKIADGHR